MIHRNRIAAVLLCSASACAWVAGASAADIVVHNPDEQGEMLPAVSGVNGKWEFSGGLADPGDYVFRAGGSFSLPLGERFGAQGDVMVANTADGVSYGAAGHLFTRDPSAYLLGVTSGIVVAPGGSLGALGVEAELYHGQWSLEAWAGVAAVDYSDALMTDETGVFAIGDIALYPSENLRLAVGGSSILGDNALRLSVEYQLSDFDLPMSLTGEGRVHADGSYSITAGIKGYFGATTDGKSLQDRHRQDDPPNRALDLYNASVGLLSETADEEEPLPDTEESCITNRQTTGVWIWDPQVETCFPNT